MSLVDIKEITTRLPTYLRQLLQDNCDIKLVYREKPTTLASPTDHQVSLTSSYEELNSQLSELDLTGCPLVTDLGGNDTIETDELFIKPSSWTFEEAQYCPISIDEARVFINNSNCDRVTLNKKPTYCLCDGSDDSNTVVFGSLMTETSWMRTLVYILPSCDEEDKTTEMDYLKKEHKKNIPTDKIDFLLVKRYNLVGYNLANVGNLIISEHYGTICAEVKCSASDKDNYDINKLTLNLQVITGHEGAHFASFWEELCFLHSCLNILSANSFNDNTIISCQYTNFEGIVEALQSIFENFVYFKKNPCKDTKQLRHEDILDKLWKILKQCRKLSDLKDGFHHFFEELAESSLPPQVASDSKSQVADITRGILDGKLAVPTLNIGQSLEFLVELGLEKLRKDYIYIIDDLFLISETVMKNWEQLCCVTVQASRDATGRKSRLSMKTKNWKIDLINHELKFSYLSEIYTAAEFMILYRNYLQSSGRECKSKESFIYVCESLCKTYIKNIPTVEQYAQWRPTKLHEVSLNMPLLELKFDDESIESWALKMSSETKWSEVTTVFNFSKSPIFPNHIYTNNDVDADETVANIKKPLYVTKLEKFVDYL